MILLEVAISFYFIIALIIFFLARWKFRLTVWSSLTVSLLLSLIVLFIIFPLSSTNQIRNKKLLVGFYLLIVIITSIIIIIYVIDKASKDIITPIKN